MRDRLLVRHFLRRFLEHDLISSNADRREVLSMAGGVLITVSLFLSVLIALGYQFSNFMPPGIASMRSIDDRFLSVSASMLVMALLAVAEWDALALDTRDTAVLGVLPIPKAVIVRAKFSAVALLAAGTCVAWNLAPTLLRAVSMPLALRIGLKGGLTLMFAQGAVTLAAGAFGFLAVFGLRETLAAVLGQDRFRSISAALQAVLVVALTSALLLLPGSYTNVAPRWLAHEGIATKAFPPLWFVGLHETLAGWVIDSLPRTRPAPYLVVSEIVATGLYRRLRPLYDELALSALMALAAVILVTIAACAWNNRRLPVAFVRRPRKSVTVNRTWKWIAPSPLHQAGFWFTLQTLPRRVSHRAVLAASLAVGLSLIVITVGARFVTVQPDVATVPVAVLAAQTLLLASVLTGFRHAAQVPAELRASSTFSLAWAGHTRSYVTGVKRAAWVALVVPILAALFLWHAALLGVRAAVLHAGFGAACSMLMMEVFFFRYRRVPFVSGYIPSVELKSQGIAYVLGFLCLCFALAWIERFALGGLGVSSGYLALVGVVAGLSAGVAAFDRVWRPSPAVLDAILRLDEVPATPTQRLDLAGSS